MEIDRGCGTVELVGFTGCDDFGRNINPLIVEGQVHGGLVQGIGQALLEGCVYDDAGQLITGSYLDYCMPRAPNVPPFAPSTNRTPCPPNPPARQTPPATPAPAPPAPGPQPVPD